MQSDIIREIVEAVLREQIVENWQFYSLIVLLTFLSGVTGNLCSAYMKKRGETLATKADMDEILIQVSATTRATEEVRSSITHADWQAREWKTLRRVKLEELMTCVYSLDSWLTALREKWVSDENITVTDDAIANFKKLATLYFPELAIEANAVFTTHSQAVVFILERSRPVRDTRTSWKQAINAINQNAAEKAQIDHDLAFNAFREGWIPIYFAAHNAVLALEIKASALMSEIACS